MKGEIKYSYCLDENNHLVHIRDIDTKESTKHHYVCLECGNEMHPRKGKIKAPHFAHNPGVSCHGESYLHKLAKRKIMDNFMQLKGMRLIRRHEVSCENEYICPFYSRHYCCNNNSMTHNLKDYYDCCQEEVHIQGFIADLLLTNSNLESRKPVLIEVLVTHACEPEKIRSGLKIIETINIESEEDIDDIIRIGFIEGKNCKLHGFKNLPNKKFNKRPIDRFILHATGGATTESIYCRDANIKLRPDSKAELNINSDKLLNYMMSFYGRSQVLAGLIYLKSKGHDIRNCLLCKYYCRNDYSGESICKLYKKCGTPHNPRQTSALQCQYYRVSQDVMTTIEHNELIEIVTEIKK